MTTAGSYLYEWGSNLRNKQIQQFCSCKATGQDILLLCQLIDTKSLNP